MQIYYPKRPPVWESDKLQEPVMFPERDWEYSDRLTGFRWD